MSHGDDGREDYYGNVNDHYESDEFVFVELCETRNIDLAFVVDSSPKPNGSVWSSILTFVNLVIDQYIINDTSVRVAFVDYTDSAWIVFNLNNDYVNADRLKEAVGRVPQSGRANRSNLSAALDKVRTQVFHSSDARWKLAIVITDQLQSSAVLSAAVNNSRSASIRVYGVGIHVSGRRLDNAALYMLPWQSIGNSREAVWVNGYDELTSDTVRSLLTYTCVNSSVERRRPPTPKQPNQPEQTSKYSVMTAARIVSNYAPYVYELKKNRTLYSCP